MGARARSGMSAAPVADTKTTRAPTRSVVAQAHAQAQAQAQRAANTGELAQRFVGNQAVLRSRGPMLQRKCDCGTTSSGGCQECKKEPVQRRADGPAPASIPRSVGQVLAREGRPMDPGTRGFMESRFGRDFGDVRVHTDADAARSARDLHAKAYTVGNHVVFGAGHYDPAGAPGQHLLAHELAHTIQQRGLQARSEGPLDLTAPGQALELQADQAADAAIRGAPVPAIDGAPSTKIARAAATAAIPGPTTLGNSWDPLPADDPRIASHGITDQSGAGTAQMAFKVSSFRLPATKGPKALAAYQRVADAGALRATISINSDGTVRRPELTQARASTGDLRTNWLRKVGWTAANAQPNWTLVGGGPARANQRPFDPIVGGTLPPGGTSPSGGAVCDLDHIVELQLGGQNIDENIQVLDASPNRSSGSSISVYLGDIAQAAYNGTAGLPTRPSEVTLHFAGVTPPTEAPLCTDACAPAGQQAPSCCVIENCATSPAGMARAGSTGPITEGPAGSVPYGLNAGGASVTVQALPQITNLQSTGPSNATASELIAGLRLRSLARHGAGDVLTSNWDTQRLPGRSRATRIPLHVSGPQPPQFDIDAATHTLRMRNRTAPVNFQYPYLSEGHLDLAWDPTTGFSGRGTLTPSLKLLSRIPLQLELDPDHLRLFLAVPPDRLRSPIPHLRFTKAELSAQLLPEFHPEGVLEFAVGPAARPFATGRIAVSADANGLVLDGTLDAHIPRVEQAQGRISYRNGQWTGGITIASTQIGIRDIQSGEVRLAFVNDELTVSGRVVAAIPGGHTVTFAVNRLRDGTIEYIGDAELRVPGLRPVNAHVRYDGHVFSASARTGIDLGPLSGDVSIHYEANPDTGRSSLSGEGTIAIRRGRVNGTFMARLRDGVLTGSGTVAVRLTDNLTGTVGITLDERRRLRVSGDLRFANPIVLFPRVPAPPGGHKEFFSRSLDIPILGITLGPLGSIGLIAQITLGFGANYYFGPGTLENIHLGVAFNPLEDDLALVADGHAELNIPAYAGIYLRLRGAIGLSALVAEVTGGLEVTAELGLRGAARSRLDLHYERDFFSIEGTTRISANPVLSLNLAANIIAKVGAFGLGHEWRKDWQLAHFELGSNLEFGLETSIGYNTRDGVRLPSVDQIRWIYPRDLSVGQILRDLIGHANR